MTLLYLLVSQYWFVLDMQVLMLGRRGLGSTSSTWVALAQPFINPVFLFYWANRNRPILIYFDTCIFQTCRISALSVGFLRKKRHNFYIPKEDPGMIISCLMTGVCLAPFQMVLFHCRCAAASFSAWQPQHNTAVVALPRQQRSGCRIDGGFGQ